MKSLTFRAACATLVIMAAVLSAGCKGKTEISGQAFIVTKGRENVKLGLLDVYALDGAEMGLASQKALSGWYQQVAAAKSTAKNLQRQLEPLNELLADLNARKKETSEDPAYGRYAKDVRGKIDEVIEQCEKKKDDTRTKYAGKGVKPLADQFWAQLPPSLTKTDADGRFTLSISGEPHYLIARSTREIFDHTESYLWITRVAGSKDARVFLSNDNLVEPENLEAILSDSAGKSGKQNAPVYAKSDEIANTPLDANTETWISESRRTLTKIVSEAKAQEHQDQVAANLATEKTKAMEREAAEKSEAMQRETAERERLLAEAAEKKRQADKAALEELRKAVATRRFEALKKTYEMVVLKDKTELKNVSIRSFYPDGIYFTHEGGGAKVKWEQLTNEWSENFRDPVEQEEQETKTSAEASLVSELVSLIPKVDVFFVHEINDVDVKYKGAVVRVGESRGPSSHRTHFHSEVFVIGLGHAAFETTPSVSLQLFPTSDVVKIGGREFDVFVGNPQLAIQIMRAKGKSVEDFINRIRK